MKAMGYSDWKGTWKEGEGSISTEGESVPKVFYSYASRFEGAPGASPEALLAAAEAGCFNQALANNFGMNQLVAESIATSVEVVMGKDDEGHPAITRIDISVEARVPGATEAIFKHCAERARTRCSIAKIIKCEIGLRATLLG